MLELLSHDCHNSDQTWPSIFVDIPNEIPCEVI